MELEFCRPGKVNRKWCNYLCPDKFHESILTRDRFEALFGIIIAFPWYVQRQEDGYVCVSYQTDIAWKSACYSFCINVGEETTIGIGNKVIIIRISNGNTKNDVAQFTKVVAQVIKRYQNGNNISC